MGFFDSLGSIITTVAPIALGFLENKAVRKQEISLAKIQAQQRAQQPQFIQFDPRFVTQSVRPQAIPQVAQPFFQQQGFPGIQLPLVGGGQVAQQPPFVQPVGTQIVGPQLNQQGFSLGSVTTDVQGVPMTRSGTPMIAAPNLFRAAPTGARAVSSFVTANPVTGNLSWFKNMGKPVLFSGDLAACRRVRRIASKARTVSRTRRTAVRRRR